MDLEALLHSTGLLQGGALLLAALTAFAVDRFSARRGLLPPLFASPLRRALGAASLAAAFYVLLFSPLAEVGAAPEPLGEVPIPLLFAAHFVMLLALLAWYFLGFEPAAAGRLRDRFASQFGLVSLRWKEDLALGVLGGGAAWMTMIAVMIVVVVVAMGLLGEDAIPKQAPDAIVVMAGLPFVVRLALGLSAGLVEELFFRGFLQARIGIGLSTFLFVLGHAGYRQPLMLVGLTAISLVLGLLVRWRQSIWAAVVAHAVFDLVQLLVIIPIALRFNGGLPIALL
jgi:membrane protease YdiL (CAAX protease family)